MQQLFHLSRLLFLLRKDFVSALKNAAVFTLLSPRGVATKTLPDKTAGEVVPE